MANTSYREMSHLLQCNIVSFGCWQYGHAKHCLASAQWHSVPTQNALTLRNTADRMSSLRSLPTEITEYTRLWQLTKPLPTSITNSMLSTYLLRDASHIPNFTDRAIALENVYLSSSVRPSLPRTIRPSWRWLCFLKHSGLHCYWEPHTDVHFCKRCLYCAEIKTLQTTV